MPESGFEKRTFSPADGNGGGDPKESSEVFSGEGVSLQHFAEETKLTPKALLVLLQSVPDLERRERRVSLPRLRGVGHVPRVLVMDVDHDDLAVVQQCCLQRTTRGGIVGSRRGG